MKCDELEKFDATSNAERSAGIERRYAYDADEVDEAIAELKAENERLTIDKRNAELRADVADATVEKLEARIAELQKENAELDSLCRKSVKIWYIH